MESFLAIEPDQNLLIDNREGIGYVNGKKAKTLMAGTDFEANAVRLPENNKLLRTGLIVR